MKMDANSQKKIFRAVIGQLDSNIDTINNFTNENLNLYSLAFATQLFCEKMTPKPI